MSAITHGYHVGPGEMIGMMSGLACSTSYHEQDGAANEIGWK